MEITLQVTIRETRKSARLTFKQVHYSSSSARIASVTLISLRIIFLKASKTKFS